MKKLLAASSIASSFLIPFSKAFAAIQVCPPGSQFSALCNLNFEQGNLIGNLIQLVFIVAVLVALFFLLYGGIRWIAAGGDKTQIEGAREAITGALIGLVIVFLAYFIVNIVIRFFTGGTGLSDLVLPQL